MYPSGLSTLRKAHIGQKTFINYLSKLLPIQLPGKVNFLAETSILLSTQLFKCSERLYLNVLSLHFIGLLCGKQVEFHPVTLYASHFLH